MVAVWRDTQVAEGKSIPVLSWCRRFHSGERSGGRWRPEPFFATHNTPIPTGFNPSTSHGFPLFMLDRWVRPRLAPSLSASGCIFSRCLGCPYPSTRQFERIAKKQESNVWEKGQFFDFIFCASRLRCEVGRFCVKRPSTPRNSEPVCNAYFLGSKKSA